MGEIYRIVYVFQNDSEVYKGLMEKMGNITTDDLCIYLSKLYKVNSFSLLVFDVNGNLFSTKQIPFNHQKETKCYINKCKPRVIGYKLNGITKQFKLETILSPFNIKKEISMIEGISINRIVMFDKNSIEIKDALTEEQNNNMGILNVNIIPDDYHKEIKKEYEEIRSRKTKKETYKRPKTQISKKKFIISLTFQKMSKI